MGRNAIATLWVGVSFENEDTKVDYEAFQSALPPELIDDIELNPVCVDDEGDYGYVYYHGNEDVAGFGWIITRRDFYSGSKAIAPEQITEAIARTQKAWQQWGLSLEQFPVKVYLIADYS